jgi:GntR family transcriptional regulator
VLYIEVHTQSPVPIYAQIMDRIRGLIRDGRLLPQAQLPSVRQLASDLEINANTVAKAYSLLERDGLLDTARRRGTVVANSAPRLAQRTVDGRLQEAVDRILEETANLGVNLGELIDALQRRGRDQATNGRRSKRRLT